MLIRITLILFLFVFNFSCKKAEPVCLYCDSKCSHLPGDINGKWNLIALGGYSAPGNQGPGWIKADPGKPVSIEFKDDTLFEYNANYTWAAEHYNRFNMIDSVNFKIYSADSLFSRPIIGTMLNANEIQLTYMGVDYGSLEKYACAEP